MMSLARGNDTCRVLLTGFDPFGGEKINPAWEAVKEFQNRSYVGFQIEVRQIPTVFHRSLEVLHNAIQEIKPNIVICVGQAGGRSDIAVERVAVNVCDADIPDNEGRQPVDEPVVAGGPAAYWSTLPVKAVVRNICNTGIPASVSHTAGTFVCNSLFYGLQHLIAEELPSLRGGFIHIPYLPVQTVGRPHVPGMSLADIVKGLEAAVITCVESWTQDMAATV